MVNIGNAAVEESFDYCLDGGCYLLDLRLSWVEIIEAVINQYVTYFLPKDIHFPLVICDQLFAIVTQ